MEDQAFPIQYQANCPYFRTRLFLPANFKNSFPLQNALCIWYLDEGKKIGRKLQFYPEARGIHDRTLSLSLFLPLSPIPAAFEREFRVSFAPGRFLLHAIDNRQLPRHDSALRTPLNKLSTYFPWHRVRRLIEHERENA